MAETETPTMTEKKYDPQNPEPLAENMVRLVFMPEGRAVEYEKDKLPYEHHGRPQSILDVAENFNVFLDHACGGNCACTTCHVVVKQGAELLNEMDDDEADRIETAADLQLASRLGCQAVIEKPGTVVVEIPSWNRNYVSEGHAPKKE
jgi:2Fe-2S ferredoxin